MIALSPSQFLALYTWFPLAVLLFIVLLVARFYERSSAIRTYYQGFMLPIVAFGVAAVRNAADDSMMGDVLADLALLIAGVSLSILCLMLYWRMIVQNRSNAQPSGRRKD